MMTPSRLSAAEVDAVLPHVLGPPSQSRGQIQRAISGFHDYLREGGIDWEALCCGPRTSPQAVLLTLFLPGRTAILLPADPATEGIDCDAQRTLTATVLDELRPRRLHYAQALLEPDAAGKRKLLESVGFRGLAPLIYMERDARYPWVDPPAPREAEWITYSDEVQATFAETVRATYEDSADCPELTGLRPMDDILAAHRASGVFDPGRWELVQLNGETAGCLLLSMVARGALLEIVYMGVVKPWRRRGVGKLLVRRAIEHCRSSTADRLTVVADGRNGPARELYEHFAFEPVTQRDALLYEWPRERGCA